MLCYEDYVKEYACIRKKQFDWVARQAIPVGLKVTVYEELQKRGDSASKVKQNLMDTPALGWLPIPVQIYLRTVFYKCTHQLDVTQGIDNVDPFPIVNASGVRSQDKNYRKEHGNNTAEDYAQHESAGFLSSTDIQAPDSREELRISDGT